MGYNLSITRSELIASLATRLPEMPVKDIEVSTKLILDGIIQALAKGHRAEIRGFGSFALTYYPSRAARNPMSGAKVHVPAKYRPHFTPGKELRLRVEASYRYHQDKPTVI